MKKLLIRSAMVLGTIGIIAGGAAAFSAFEAHVVNVTATIENATDISTTDLTLGNVFPQEILNNPVTLSLSSSFLSGGNTNADEVDYMIKQKPYCGLPNAPVEGQPTTYSAYEQVTENSEGVYSCPDAGYVELPLLCPYLSKEGGNEGDVSVPSFHGPTDLADWTDAVSASLAATGKLFTAGPTSDTWTIDMHTPCFAGECAQDWDTFVTTANPAVTTTSEPYDTTYYQANPNLEGQEMGCDLWFEVTGIPQVTPTPTPIAVPSDG